MYGAASGSAPYGQHPPTHAAAPPPAGGAPSYGYATQQPAAPPSGGYAPQGYGPPAPAPAAGPGYGGGYGGGYDGGYGGGPGMGGGQHGPPPGGWHGPPAGAGYGPAGRFTAVKLRGLPFGVREHEIAMFLGLDPVDILIVQRGGRATGEAFAILGHPAEVEMATRKNKAYLGTRYIEVYEARKMDYYRAVADVLNSGGGGRGGGPASPSGRDRSRSPPPRRPQPGAGTSKIVKMRGLPFSATPDDICNFFADPAVALASLPTPGKVTIATSGDNRPNGMAFVEFETPEAAAAALAKDRHLMGSRYIELFLSTDDERARFQPAGAGASAGPHFI